MHVARKLLAVLAPPSCPACGAPGAGVCPACVRAIGWLRRTCPRCGLPRHRDGCPAAGATFPRAWAPVAYEGTGGALVRALKFRAALPVADVMAAHMAANLPADLRAALGGGAALVPVPAHRGRRRRRGYDPAALLTRALGRRLGATVVPCLRRRGGGRQVGAGRAARHRSTLAATVRGPPPARALLVDDVHTTGATLDACAAALGAAGAEVVAAIAYARTL